MEEFYLLKAMLLHGCFLCFLNCSNGTKSRKPPQVIAMYLPLLIMYSVSPYLISRFLCNCNILGLIAFRYRT